MKIATALLALLAAAATAVAGEKQLWAKSFLGRKAPELVVGKWLSPAPETKGKFLLLDFWATWCGPCRAAIPHLNAFQEKFADRLVVIGISSEPEATVRKLTEPAIKYASAIDPEKRMDRALEIRGIPHCILIDPAGIVRWEGYPLLEGHELTEQVIADVLAKHGQ